MYAGLEGALSGTAATGLILGGGALGSGLLVVGLTVMAVRRGNREERRRRTAVRRASVPRQTEYDPYPQQPYSAGEPKSHRPYSQPYKRPRQDSLGKTNGHLAGQWEIDE